MSTEGPKVAGSVAAALAVGRPAEWFAVFDQGDRCVYLQRGDLGEIPEQLLGLRSVEPANSATSDVSELVGSVLERAALRDTVQVFDDPQLGPRVFEYQIRPVKDGAKACATVVSCTETTARRAHAHALRLHGQVLEAMDEGVLLVDVNARVRMFNPAAERMFDCECGELLERSVADISPALAQLLRSRVDRTEQLALSRGSGAGTIVSCTSRWLSIDDADHALIVMRDITERISLEREVLEVEQRERERISHDLHDGLGQELTGVALMLRSIGEQLGDVQPLNQARLHEVIAIVNGMIANTREMASGIFAASIPDGDLVAALKSLAERTSARSGLAVHFSQRGAGFSALDKATVTNLFRIAQEATTNAIRHGAATAIEIALIRERDRLALTIEDNGHGFDVAGSGDRGAGLRIMRFRAHAIAAQLRIGSAPRGGTTVECTLPAPRGRQ